MLIATRLMSDYEVTLVNDNSKSRERKEKVDELSAAS